MMICVAQRPRQRKRAAAESNRTESAGRRGDILMQEYANSYFMLTALEAPPDPHHPAPPRLGRAKDGGAPPFLAPPDLGAGRLPRGSASDAPRRR